MTKEEGGRHTPFVSNFSPQLFTRTACVLASLFLPEGVCMCVCVCAPASPLPPLLPGVEMVMPGEDTQLTLTLSDAIPLETGQRFTLRDDRKTIGHGVVTEIIH